MRIDLRSSSILLKPTSCSLFPRLTLCRQHRVRSVSNLSKSLVVTVCRFVGEEAAEIILFTMSFISSLTDVSCPRFFCQHCDRWSEAESRLKVQTSTIFTILCCLRSKRSCHEHQILAKRASYTWVRVLHLCQKERIQRSLDSLCHRIALFGCPLVMKKSARD